MSVNLRPRRKLAPCLITTFDPEGNITSEYVVTRAKLRTVTGYEAEQVSYTKQIVVTQETGEPLNIGRAKDFNHAIILADAWLVSHEEHLGYEIINL